MRVSMRDLAWMINRLPNPNAYEGSTLRMLAPTELKVSDRAPEDIPEYAPNETILFHKRNMSNHVRGNVTRVWQEWELEIA